METLPLMTKIKIRTPHVQYIKKKLKIKKIKKKNLNR